MFLNFTANCFRLRPVRKKFYCDNVWIANVHILIFGLTSSEPLCSINTYVSVHRFIRMTSEKFQHQLQFVGPYISKGNCWLTESISPPQQLCLCMRYLATGDSQSTQSFSFRVGRATVSKIIKETSEGIWMAYGMLTWWHPVKANSGKKLRKSSKSNGTFQIL